jgi:hypothetical protein
MMLSILEGNVGLGKKREGEIYTREIDEIRVEG